jgi:hypothetical protein
MVGGCLHFSEGGEFRGEFFDTTGRIAIATRPVLGSVSTVEDARLGAAIRCGTIASAAGQLFFSLLQRVHHTPNSERCIRFNVGRVTPGIKNSNSLHRKFYLGRSQRRKGQ